MDIRLYREGDENQIVPLLNSCFGAQANPEDYRNAGALDEGFDLGSVWVAEEAGQIVGHVMSIKRRVNLGSFVNVAGVAAVCTKPEFRGRGIATQMMKQVSKEIKEDVSMLYTDYASSAHRIYRSTGYSPLHFFHAYSGEKWDVERTIDHLAKSASLDVRPFQTGDEETIERVYSAWADITSYSVARSHRYWTEKLFKRNFWHTFSFRDFNPDEVLVVPGRAYAYLDMLPAKTMRIREVLAMPGDTAALASLLYGALSSHKDVNQVIIILPEGQEAFERLLAEMYWISNSELLVSVRRPRGLLQALQKALSIEGCYEESKDSFQLRLYNDVEELEPLNVNFHFQESDVKPSASVKLHQSTFLRIVAGEVDPVRVFLNGGLEVNGDPLLPLRALKQFKKRPIMMWPTDRWRGRALFSKPKKRRHKAKFTAQ